MHEFFHGWRRKAGVATAGWHCQYIDLQPCLHASQGCFRVPLATHWSPVPTESVQFHRLLWHDHSLQIQIADEKMRRAVSREFVLRSMAWPGIGSGFAISPNRVICRN